MVRLSPEQWLKLIRLRWGVENNCHNTWDKVLREDERLFIRRPRGMLAVQLLRRLAYTLLTLFRSVTQWTEETRAVPWKTLMDDIRIMLLTQASHHVDGLRSDEPTATPF